MKPGLNAIMGATGSGKSSWVPSHVLALMLLDIMFLKQFPRSFNQHEWLQVHDEATPVLLQISGYTSSQEGSCRPNGRGSYRWRSSTSKLQMSVRICGASASDGKSKKNCLIRKFSNELNPSPPRTRCRSTHNSFLLSRMMWWWELWQSERTWAFPQPCASLPTCLRRRRSKKSTSWLRSWDWAEWLIQG